MPGTQAPDTKSDLAKGIQALYDHAATLLQLLEEGNVTKGDFIRACLEGQEKYKALIGVVVRHSRSRGQPVRADGQPDLRGNFWKDRPPEGGGSLLPKVKPEPTKTDLRKV
jgi:hypothetical protein